MRSSQRSRIRSGGISGIVLLIAGAVRAVSPVAVFLFLFFHLSGCEFSPTDPETDDQYQDPTVTLLQPDDGEVVTGTVTLVVRAEDARGVENVSFYIDGRLATNGLVTKPPYQYVWDTKGLFEGSAHTISAKATGSSGNTALSQTIHVTVGGVSENPQPLGPGGTWNLVFSDEFEGNNLDLTKWHPNWFGSDDNAITRPINDAEASCYDPAQVTVSGGYLHFTAVSSGHPDCVTKNGTQADYASGMIMSNGRYHFTYGFIEARIYLPPGTGTAQNWAAFWTNGQDWPQDGEIDIMETLGGGSYTRWTYHYDVDSGPEEDHDSYTPGGNMIDESGWHVFGAYWQPDLITFYYDGAEVGYVASRDLQGDASITSSSHYIILNLGLNNKYPITVPSTMTVDYVRHWTHDTALGVFISNEYDYVSRANHE